jgi:hypothetical protein
MLGASGSLRVAPCGKGALGVVIDAPPMNLIGSELVRDLVGLLGALGSAVPGENQEQWGQADAWHSECPKGSCPAVRLWV